MKPFSTQCIHKKHTQKKRRLRGYNLPQAAKQSSIELPNLPHAKLLNTLVIYVPARKNIIVTKMMWVLNIANISNKKRMAL